MRFAYTAEQGDLSRDLRRYCAGLLDDETHSKLTRDPDGPTMRRVVRQPADDEWLVVGCSPEYQHAGREGVSAAERFHPGAGLPPLAGEPGHPAEVGARGGGGRGAPAGETAGPRAVQGTKRALHAHLTHAFGAVFEFTRAAENECFSDPKHLEQMRCIRTQRDTS
jgi:hypothetical protein